MNSKSNSPLQDVLIIAKQDLVHLHTLAKQNLDLNTWPKIVKLSDQILNYAKTLSPILQDPLKTDFLGLVEDFKDYNLDSTLEERHAFQDYLMNNLRSVIERLDSVNVDEKAA